jgi:hypothetical protein
MSDIKDVVRQKYSQAAVRRRFLLRVGCIDEPDHVQPLNSTTNDADPNSTIWWTT